MVEAEAAGGAFDFLSVGGADGGEFGGVVEAGLHLVDGAAALGAVGAELLRRDVGEGEHARVGVALMFQIMDGEDGGGLSKRGVAQGGVEEEREQAGGPVVAMDDIGNPAELEAEIEGTAAKEGEAEIIVGEVAAVAGVNLGASEEALMFECVNGDL